MSEFHSPAHQPPHFPPPQPQGPLFSQEHNAARPHDPSGSPFASAPVTSPTPPPPPPSGRSFGWPALVACTLAAAVLGGTASAGALTALSASDVESVPGSADSAQIEQASLPGADADVASAAAIASPSVVTLGVSAGSAGGSGSGIILDQEGHVLTNTHVVTLGGTSSQGQITVQLDDGTSTSAQIVGTDPLSDLAVIKLDNAAELNLTPATFGSSGDLQVGDEAIAIGAPLGLSGTVTTGIISTLDRTITVASAAVDEPTGDQPRDDGRERFEFGTPNDLPGSARPSSAGSVFLNVIQTDASINQGNSGGALVDGHGQIVGINVAIASTGETAGSIGVGFAIPGDYAQRIAEDLIASGEASHGLLGVLAADASPDAAVNKDIVSGTGQTSSGGGFTAGALVTEVEAGSPADGAGLEPGDVITAVEGRRISDSRALTAVIREYPAEQEVDLTVDRGGEEITLQATLSAAER
ncbi:S1C family serine protease [Bogoriella caseilytica]|uniref:Putative serine protease PepD n=1 Tax=Bogoriella caseilytica TaxID=56055 RepID=A0A3N2BE04_9MICO|nr:trypsin-like peptidase domain-containing protein [Bogoriella caseilytica]ROR73487.1 putative serine protease PepD [Bogoriella caseilytica]